MLKNKIKQLKELKRIVVAEKKNGRRIVFTNGCFDIIHPGHIEYLKKAKGFGDRLIVAINSDTSVRKIKGLQRPIFPAKDRAKLLAACEYVDFVIVFSEITPLRLIRSLRPDVLVKGADWARSNIVGADLVQSYGGEVFREKLVRGYSTSSIIAKIKKLADEKKSI